MAMVSTADLNPFEYNGPVSPDEMIDRGEEIERLLGDALGGHNQRLVAPRRYGKTSLLHRVLRDARREGAPTVYVDFFGVLTLDDIAARIERAYAAQLQGPLAQWFLSVRRSLRPIVRAGGGPVPASVEVEFQPQGGQQPLLERLALPRRIHERTGRTTVVVFDEFQDIVRAGHEVDAIMRSEIQHHGAAAGYVYAGSHVGMMRTLFADKRRAFYAQAGPVPLGPLPAEAVVDHVGEHFERTGRGVGSAVGNLLDIAGGHPQRTMLLAHELWRQTPVGEIATEERALAALDDVMVRLSDELQALWNGLTSSQQRAMAAVADNTSALYSRATGERTGATRGGALRDGTRGLVDAGEAVQREGTATGYQLVDPLLSLWVRAGRRWPPPE
jgi:uncharacterized protein